ncbi:hypothetical protein FOA43_001446 [Brettanomyces nanus]|uniref:YMC020W-like alpha/beta hydrolase domain-containing protein n=1 Tax=Eeniella nana TaxID=13502 RepID=A0A875S4D7_EENNA|nr:uncharacterized protein FOA43_001446 [Brettanomyces nanus]QPG74124.1 hypothetical protein FOA43_001446 [Brettanomyces nanus]
MQFTEGKDSDDDGSIKRSSSSVSISNLLLHPFYGSKDRRVPNVRTRYSISSYQQKHDNSKDLQMIPVTGVDIKNGIPADQQAETPAKTQNELTLEEYRNEMKEREPQDESHREGEENEENVKPQGIKERWSIWNIWESDQLEEVDRETPRTVEETEESASVHEDINGEESEHVETSVGAKESFGFIPRKSSVFFWANRSSMVSPKPSIDIVTTAAEELEPNELSKVVSSVGEEPIIRENTESSRWWSWISNRNATKSSGNLTEPVTAVSENDNEHQHENELRKSTKEAENIIKIKTSAYLKPSSWAFYKRVGDDCGQISIMGTKSLKEPLTVQHDIQCQFYIKEQDRFKTDVKEDALELSQIDSSVVIPKLDWNYRNLTTRTKLRILVSSIGGPVQKCFLGETHLYHDSRYSRRSKTVEHKKAVIVGVHSFLPLQLVEKFFNEPTGSSDEMVEMTRLQLLKWGEEHNTELEIETIALDGYGSIFDRVSNCISLMENWITSVEECDILLMVSNMQSVAISVHLLSRLITAGYLNNVSKVGMINIGGSFLGPAIGLDSKLTVKPHSSQSLENDILLELFDFQDRETLQSRELIRHMKILISQNVKISFIGSMTHPIVPIYSSLCVHLAHPNIYRAIYVDGASNQPDFLVTLLNLALTVKNLNMEDHKLLLELSNFFLESGNRMKDSKVRANSMIENGNVYRIGIRNMLETSDLMFERPVKEEVFDLKEFNMNEYHLPWCMRGFMEEMGKLKRKEEKRRDQRITIDTQQMIEQLLEEFRSWEPKEKEYRDLRYCIEALKEMKGSELM